MSMRILLAALLLVVSSLSSAGAVGDLTNAGVPLWLLAQDARRITENGDVPDATLRLWKSMAEVAATWLAKSERAYQMKFVDKLKVKSEESLLADFGLAEGSGTRTMKQHERGGGTASKATDELDRLIDQTKSRLVVTASTWLDDASRNYMDIVVARLSSPGPSTAWSSQTLAQGTVSLFGATNTASSAVPPAAPTRPAAKTDRMAEVGPSAREAVPTPTVRETLPPLAQPAEIPAQRDRAPTVEAPTAEPRQKQEEKSEDAKQLDAPEGARSIAEQDVKERDSQIAEKRRNETMAREQRADKDAEAQRQRLAHKQRRLEMVENHHSAAVLAEKSSALQPRQSTGISLSARPAKNTIHNNLSTAPRSNHGSSKKRRARRANDAKKSRYARCANRNCNAQASRRAAIPATYIVAPGDLLWNIALRHAHDPQPHVKAIYRVNRRTIRNPEIIWPCQPLNLPR